MPALRLLPLHEHYLAGCEVPVLLTWMHTANKGLYMGWPMSHARCSQSSPFRLGFGQSGAGRCLGGAGLYYNISAIASPTLGLRAGLNGSCSGEQDARC